MRPLRLAPKGEHPPEEPNGVCVTFTVHRVAFQVLFTFYRGRFDAALRHDVASQLTPLWPLGGTTRAWPCGGFDLEGLEDVAERFADGEPVSSEGATSADATTE